MTGSTCRVLCFTAVISFVMSFLPTDKAIAYCTYGWKWSQSVPVYIVSRGDFRVERFGLQTATVERYLRAAIAEWNEASGMNHTLFYAGQRANKDQGNGVTFYATKCGSLACGPSYLGCTLGSAPNIAVALYPPACTANPVTWTVTPPGTDLQTVVAHELGHALGLDHSDKTCGTSQNGQTRGIMRSWANQTNGAWRWLRRDDISGIRAIYGKRDNRVVRYQQSTDGTNWDGGHKLVGNFAHTPVSATTAFNEKDNWLHGITWADTNDQVVHLTGIDTGWYHSQATVVDNTSNGMTWDAPAIGRGNGRVMIAWISDEVSTGYQVRLRWALRNIGTTSFNLYNDGPTTFHKSIGVSYSADRDVFLLTYIDSQTRARVLTIDSATGQQISDTDTQLVLHDVGSAACEIGTNGSCTVPMATSGVNGPCLGWIRGHVDATRQFVVDGNSNVCYYSLSSSDLTRDMRIGASVGYVGGFNQAGPYAFVYRLPGTSANPVDVKQLYTDYWPIGVGSLNKGGASVLLRAYYAHSIDLD